MNIWSPHEFWSPTLKWHSKGIINVPNYAFELLPNNILYQKNPEYREILHLQDAYNTF